MRPSGSSMKPTPKGTNSSAGSRPAYGGFLGWKRWRVHVHSVPVRDRRVGLTASVPQLWHASWAGNVTKPQASHREARTLGSSEGHSKSPSVTHRWAVISVLPSRECHFVSGRQSSAAGSGGWLRLEGPGRRRHAETVLVPLVAHLDAPEPVPHLGRCDRRAHPRRLEIAQIERRQAG